MAVAFVHQLRADGYHGVVPRSTDVDELARDTFSEDDDEDDEDDEDERDRDENGAPARDATARFHDAR